MPLLDLIGRLIEGFSRGKVVGPLVGSVVLGLVVAIYLIETADTELERYAKAAAVLKDLEGVMTASGNPDVISASETIAERVTDIVAEATETDESLSDGWHRAILALVMGLPWAVFSMVGVVEGTRRESDWEYGLFGCIALAVLLGGAGYAVPPEIHWFYRYLLMPIAAYGVLGGVFLAAGNDEADENGGHVREE